MKSNFLNVGSIRASSGKGIIIGLVCVVALSVSLLSCATYIELMSNAFPGGLFLALCYVGAFANLILMIVLLAGKFVWFRPGYHEWASWGITLAEVIVCILNLMLAFELHNGHGLQPPLDTWYNFAPITPVFSMIGAIILIMTSSELRARHNSLLIEEQKEQAEQQLELQQHTAQIAVKSQYVAYIETEMAKHLNSPAVQATIALHAQYLVTQAMSGVSGLPAIPAAAPVVDSTLAPANLAQNATLPAPPPVSAAPDPVTAPPPFAAPDPVTAPPAPPVTEPLPAAAAPAASGSTPRASRSKKK